jgi:hypothetical protein
MKDSVIQSLYPVRGIRGIAVSAYARMHPTDDSSYAYTYGHVTNISSLKLNVIYEDLNVDVLFIQAGRLYLTFMSLTKMKRGLKALYPLRTKLQGIYKIIILKIISAI